jgi:hypothetical protein
MVSHIPLRLILPVIVCSALAGTSASADPGTRAGAGASAAGVHEGREAEAEAKFRQGSAAFDAGRTDEACAEFTESLQLYANLSTLLNLALCQETQGRLASAWRGFTEAAAWASDPSLRDRRDFANQHALKLQRSLGRVEIHLPDGPAPSITIDGEPLTGYRLLGPVFVDPGEHVVDATAPGRIHYRTTIAVSPLPAEQVVVTIPPLQPDASTSPPPPILAPPSSNPRGRRVAGFVVGGIGLLAAGLGGYFAGDALSKTSTLADSCGGGCDAGAAREAEIASAMAFGTGVAAAAIGAWLVAGAPPDSPSATWVVVSPRIAARQGELLLRATW